jgi:hypothetical protein
MRIIGSTLIALMLAAWPAQADGVSLRDGTYLEGTAIDDGNVVIVRQALGETRVPRAFVARIAPTPRNAAPADPVLERERRRGVPPAPLAPELALEWQTDEARARQLAATLDLLVLTFRVVGDLGTGRC